MRALVGVVSGLINNETREQMKTMADPQMAEGVTLKEHVSVKKVVKESKGVCDENEASELEEEVGTMVNAQMEGVQMSVRPRGQEINSGKGGRKWKRAVRGMWSKGLTTSPAKKLLGLLQNKHKGKKGYSPSLRKGGTDLTTKESVDSQRGKEKEVAEVESWDRGQKRRQLAFGEDEEGLLKKPKMEGSREEMDTLPSADPKI